MPFQNKKKQAPTSVKNLLHQAQEVITVPDCQVDLQDEVIESVQYSHDVEESLELDWTVGRRIVELKVLADGLKKCCSCELKLDLSNIVNETRSGYGSWLDIKCLSSELNKVSTGKRHQTMKQGRHIFSVNTKVAGAII